MNHTASLAATADKQWHRTIFKKMKLLHYIKASIVENRKYLCGMEEKTIKLIGADECTENFVRLLLEIIRNFQIALPNYSSPRERKFGINDKT